MKRFSILNRLPLAPVIAVMFGIVAAILVLATPQWLFQDAIVASGLPNLIAAASPPLGAKAKILSAILAAALVGAILWAVITMIERLIESRGETRTTGTVADDDVNPLDPILADRRRPIFAEADLGAPLMSDEAAAVAREELILDIALPDLHADLEFDTLTFHDGTEMAPSAFAEAEEAVSPPLSRPPHQARDDEDGDGTEETVGDLMFRLEAALERRQQRLGKDAPMPGDIQSLRAALGLGTSH